jgi:hypothetical protein
MYTAVDVSLLALDILSSFVRPLSFCTTKEVTWQKWFLSQVTYMMEAPTGASACEWVALPAL